MNNVLPEKTRLNSFMNTVITGTPDCLYAPTARRCEETLKDLKKAPIVESSSFSKLLACDILVKTWASLGFCFVVEPTIQV
jgi:hypothetical protein